MTAVLIMQIFLCLHINTRTSTTFCNPLILMGYHICLHLSVLVSVCKTQVLVLKIAETPYALVPGAGGHR